MKKERERKWLSHIVDKNTPLYGGVEEIDIVPQSQIDQGDGCNTVKLGMPNHCGTHVDVPLHFIKNGKSIVDYSAEEWVFSNPMLLFLDPEKGSLIRPQDINIAENHETDIVLFRTSFEVFREDEVYWQENPGIVPEMADFLLAKCPNLKAVGMNIISISSYCRRDIGRLAHRAFLERDIRIIEDMSLLSLQPGDTLDRIIVMPLRIANGDGAPCTVIAEKGSK